jgi:DNA polymerase-3 subunit epsilon
MGLRLVAAWAACFGALLAAAAALLLALDASLGTESSAELRRLLAEGRPALLLLVVVTFGLTGVLANWLVRAHFAPVRRLAESTRLIAGGNPGHRIAAEGPAEMRELAEAINLLAARHEGLLEGLEARVSRVRVDLDQEKSRLAALMSELAQSVVVCNMEGRILLYNERARQMFSGPGGEVGDAEPGYIGLGRSLYALLERDLVSHALEQVPRRRVSGETVPVVVFMAALRTDKVVRAQLAPVASGDGRDSDPAAGMAGFVLLLEDVGEAVTRAERRDQLVQRYAEQARASLAGVRAAVENLESHPELDAARRRQFTGIISEETRRLAEALERTARDYAENATAQWLPEQIRATDLAEVIRRRVENRIGLRVRAGEIDGSLWMTVDSFTLAQAVSYLARRLKDEFQVGEIGLGLAAAGRHARLEVVWDGKRMPASIALAWEGAALSSGGESSPLTFREVLNRHHGEAWYEFDQASQLSSFRLLLPLAVPGRPAEQRPARGGRPEYYDFDLFRQPGQTQELDGRPLKELSYTVLDTETTGLAPSAGDEIISIGAVRIVNGRLLAGERFEQLLDPRRPLHPASMEIHGIKPEALRGKPPIERVLPAFHKFCEDTVLVGHNVAFDLRFLQLKEKITGVRFTQPVLDTLLLSAALHENLASHQLEAVAERFGVSPAGRHTAVGDALMTGEIFLRMIPLLAERGIVTLKQAREACEQTYYARLRY